MEEGATRLRMLLASPSAGGMVCLVSALTALDEAMTEESGDGGRGPTQADILIDLADAAELFHSADGTALLVRFSDAIEGAQAEGGKLAHIRGAASKAAEQACRIAGVLTLWDDLEAREVQADAMSNGIELAQFYLAEASRLASAATVSTDIARAEALRKWLLTGWAESEVLVRDVMQFGPRALRENPKARAAIDLLQKHGWLTDVTGCSGASRARKEMPSGYGQSPLSFICRRH